MKQDEESAAAHERTRNSDYVMVRTSAYRFAIAKITGVSAHGTPGTDEMYGVKRATVIEGMSHLKWGDAMKIMKEIDLEGFRPE